MTDYKTFGEMSKEEQLALFVAWQEGKKIECCVTPKERPDFHALYRTDLISLCNKFAYRIAAPKPFFDFSAFNEKWKWAARDEGGDIFFYKEQPTKNVSGGIWEAGRNNDLYCVNEIVKKSLTNLFDPSILWQDSLVAREVVE